MQVGLHLTTGKNVCIVYDPNAENDSTLNVSDVCIDKCKKCRVCTGYLHCMCKCSSGKTGDKMVFIEHVNYERHSSNVIINRSYIHTNSSLCVDSHPAHSARHFWLG